MKKAIAIKRDAVTAMIESPIRESKSNGRIERAIRKWQAQFRTIRHHVESRIGEKLENASAIIEWMIVWVADIISKYAIQENGRTTYEMTTQHTVKHKIVGFAERVHYRFKIQDSKKDKTSNSDSGIGYFVGIVNRNTQYLVATKEGIVTCSTISRMPDEESYSRECIDHVKTKYTEYIKDGAKSGPVARYVTIPATVIPDPNPIETTYVPRSMMLRTEDFNKHGYTAGCPECVRRTTGVGARQAHTKACRERMENLISQDEEGLKRVSAQQDRQDKSSNIVGGGQRR